MLAKQFFDLTNSWKPTYYSGLEDFADKLNFLYTPIILAVMLMINTAKSYVLDNIACYSPTVFSGKNYDDYLINYCWTHGTIPINDLDPTPDNVDQWEKLDKTDRISYYQWVPFYLGFQIILFNLPRMFWRSMIYNRMGTDLESIIQSADSAMHAKSKSQYEQELNFSVNLIASMLYEHREVRMNSFTKLKTKCFPYFRVCVFSKRFGTWIMVCYMFTKFLYLLNCCFQLYAMQTFLGFEFVSGWNFGWQLLPALTNNTRWRSNLVFPRVTICHGIIRQLGAQKNAFNAICSLPINMLNEKIFIFLWFWVVSVAIYTLFSIPSWMMRMYSYGLQSDFILKCLRIANVYTLDKIDLLKVFVKTFLRHDGVFMMRMMYINCGSQITTVLIARLWMKFCRFHSFDKMEDLNEEKRPDPFDRIMKKLYDCK